MSHFIRSMLPCRNEHYIILSIAFYSIGTVLIQLVNSTTGRFIQLIAVLFLLWRFIITKKRFPFKSNCRILYLFLTIWILWLVIKLMILNYDTIPGNEIFGKLIEVLINVNFLPTIMILFLYMLRSENSIDLNYIFNLLLKLGQLSLIFLPFAIFHMINFQWSWSNYLEEGSYQDFIANSSYHINSIIPPIILIFFKKYLPTKVWSIFLILNISSLFISIYCARRSGTALILLYFACCYVIYMIYDNKVSKFKLMIIGFIIIYLLYYFVSNNTGSIFSLLIERGTIDSRSDVEYSFFRSMNLEDWIFGKGIFGTYYDWVYNKNRSGIETGYLTLILRGGIVYLLMYVTLLFKAAYLGFTKSKNLFIKSIAVCIIISIIELYPFGWPEFSLKFFFIYLGVFLCLSKRYCNMTDSQIKAEICNKNIFKYEK